MKKSDYLDLLNQGNSFWNNWRLENPEVNPNLSGADLSNKDLRSYNLSSSFLVNCDFSNANLTRADLSGSRLIKANFFRSDCWRVNFYGSILWEANFTQANLKRAIFHWSHFRNTNFTEASFGETLFAHVDLRNAQGLETTKHRVASEITISTLYFSNGEIPSKFLQEIGFIDELTQITLPVLYENENPFQTCFISYSSNDEKIATQLYHDLLKNGVPVWFAPEDLKIGQEFEKVINKEIHLRDKLILIFSTSSVKSDWVAYEVEQAEKSENMRHPDWPEDEPLENPVLFPITIDKAIFDCDEQWARKIKRRRHIGDFTQWKNPEKYKENLDRLLRDLKGS